MHYAQSTLIHAFAKYGENVWQNQSTPEIMQGDTNIYCDRRK